METATIFVFVKEHQVGVRFDNQTLPNRQLCDRVPHGGERRLRRGAGGTGYALLPRGSMPAPCWQRQMNTSYARRSVGHKNRPLPRSARPPAGRFSFPLSII